jgi:hypothetical protein
MQRFRQHIVFKFICLALAFHIFNVSVDAPDAQPDSVPEDLTINDQESVIELVLETWLGFDNAVEEHDEPGDESHQLEINKEFQLYTNVYPTIEFHQPYLEIPAVRVFNKTNLPDYISEIVPPPPKA